MPANALGASVARLDKISNKKRSLNTATLTPPKSLGRKLHSRFCRLPSSGRRHDRRVLHRCRCDVQRHQPCELLCACHHGAHAAERGKEVPSRGGSSVVRTTLWKVAEAHLESKAPYTAAASAATAWYCDLYFMVSLSCVLAATLFQPLH